MQYLIDYLKKNKLIVIALVILVIGIIVSTIIVLLKNNKFEPKKPDQLTKTEEKYPEAPAQPFIGKSSDSGGLIITSNVKDIRVMIDSPDEEVATDSAKLPINTNPFKISSMPVGEHNILAFKDGYALYEDNFKIEKDKITRVEITLTPVDQVDKNGEKIWITKLPIQAQYYSIEYNQDANNIIATLNPPPAEQTTKQAQIDFLKKLVLNDLKNIGVDTSKEKVIWVNQ